jgi:hypothetical protein
VFEQGERYRFATTAVIPGASVAVDSFSIATGDKDPAAARAAATPAAVPFLHWARFPFYEIARDASGTTVRIVDARYAGPGSASWAALTVRLPGAAADTSTREPVSSVPASRPLPRLRPPPATAARKTRGVLRPRVPGRRTTLFSRIRLTWCSAPALSPSSAAVGASEFLSASMRAECRNSLRFGMSLRLQNLVRTNARSTSDAVQEPDGKINKIRVLDPLRRFDIRALVRSRSSIKVTVKRKLPLARLER